MTPDQFNTLRQAARILADEAGNLPQHPTFAAEYRAIRLAVSTIRDVLLAHGESL